MSDHSSHNNGGIGSWIFSRTGVATAVAVAILGFLIYTGHSAHLLGASLWLLILACPLLHILMHGSHGSHGGGDKDKRNRPPERPAGHQH